MTDWTPSNESPIKCIIRQVSLLRGCSSDDIISCEENPYKFLKDGSLSDYAKWIIKESND